MPTRRSKRNKTEDQEHRARLLWLEEMGIPTGCAGDPAPEPNRLTFEQIDHELARVCELPSGAVAVVVPAKMTVLTSGILITDMEVTIPFDGPQLDLSDPEEISYYQDLIAGWYPSPPNILNHWLMSKVPLRVRREEGLIIATGWCFIPPPNATTKPL